MIERKNFCGLHTPQELGSLSAFTIPLITKPVYAPGGIRIVALDVADPVYAGRWIVSKDRSRAWKLSLCEFRNRDGQVVATHYLVTREVGVDAPLAPDAGYTSEFRMTDLPVLSDRSYRHCNFTQPAPIEVDGKQQGVRLFPGDDMPMTFRECNLINCEPPAGSTIQRCNTTVKIFRALSGTETITIDGESVTLTHHKDIIYGRFNPGKWSYDYLAEPQDIEVD
jgi:hypothetical protein